MKEIVRYETEDGQTFDDADKARAHESALMTSAEVDDFIEEHYADKTRKYKNTLKKTVMAWQAHKIWNEKS